MAERIPVAVVGAGHLGRIHARVLSELDLAELVAVVDVDPEKARAVAEPLGAAHASSLAELPDRVRAVVVATPTSTHHAVARELLLGDRHVMVEKPITRTVEEARDLVDLADSRGHTLMVGHSERFNPVVTALDGIPFAPRYVESQRVSPFSFRSADVGVVLDMMIHDIDIILHLVQSPVVDVQAMAVPVIGVHEDIANARLTFANGAVANATASRVALKTERTIRAFSSEAYVALDYHKKSGRVIRRGPGLRLPPDALKQAFAAAAANPLAFMQKDLVEIHELPIADVEPLKAENQAFLTAIASGAEPPVTGRHGLLALETAKRIVAAAEASLARVRS